MNNKTHEANHWIHNIIITIGSALYKPNHVWFFKIFLGALQTCLTVSKVSMYGGQQLLEYKTLILTSHITDGKPIRVVDSRLIKRIKGKNGKTQEKVGSPGTFVSTNLDLSPEEIIASYSKRFSIEEIFKDMKEVCGLGKQQVRSLEKNGN